MSTESNSASHLSHPKSHNGVSGAAHKPARKPRSTTSKRHTNRVAGVLALRGLADNAVEGFSEQLSELKEKSMQSAQAVENRIVKNPKSSVLIALGVGYAWGRLRRWF